MITSDLSKPLPKLFPDEYEGEDRNRQEALEGDEVVKYYFHN